MTLPTVYPTQYAGTSLDFLQVKCDRSGAARVVAGSVAVSSGTATDTYVGLVPFNKGARFVIGDKSVYVGDLGTTDTLANLGYIYDNNTVSTNDPDAWVSASTAIRSGGFLTVDENQGMQFVAEDNGWIAVQITTAATNAAANILYSFVEAYDGLGVNNSNNQSA